MAGCEKLENLRQRAGRVKLFASDLDGTLHDSRHVLSEENRKALDALADKGIVLVAATGRSRSSVPETITGIAGFKYLITSNGAKVYVNATGEIISERFVGQNALEYISPFFEDEEVLMEVFWDGVPHVEEKRYNNALEYGVPRKFSGYFFSTRVPLKNFSEAVDENSEIIENIGFKFGSDTVKARALQYLEKRTDLYELTSFLPLYYELGGVGVTKGSALAFIAEREGIMPDEIIAFGDNDNDVPMMEYAGISVAVANSSPGALAAADLVTAEDNNNSCVNAALKLLGMI